jgi:hydroxymethylpyrimidine pyrophosphatase-like HAD family hydrolase
MKTTYIFDVDGTLAPPNEPIDSHFMHWLEHWLLKRDAYLCTNNTYQNILPRLGNRLLTGCKAIFTSGGNSIWMNGKEAVTSSWRPSADLLSMLSDVVKDSEFKIRSGPNIEYRTGLISFSIVGKNASKEDRQRYILWDKSSKERRKLVEKIHEAFPSLIAFSAGETSIDICERGRDKSQILKYFTQGETLNFIANETHSHGNDKPLAQAMYKFYKGKYNVQTVANWQETFDYLKKVR